MSGVFLFLSVVRITLPLPLRYRFRSHNRLSSLFHFLPAHRPPPTTAFAHLQIATVKVYLLGNGYFGPEPLPRNSFLGVHSYSPYTHTIATESVNCGGDGISKRIYSNRTRESIETPGVNGLPIGQGDSCSASGN